MIERRRHPQAAFTLVELIVVIGLIAFVMGMIALMPRNSRRDSDVQAAANELAGVIRLARNLAFDKKETCAITFNIQNGPGTSGKVLNNWSGGHWYQIVGSDDNDVQGHSWPAFPEASYGDTAPFSNYVNSVKRCYFGDRHVLPPHRVRFLALGDEDTGCNGVGSVSGSYTLTYPRPWFGFYNAAKTRLYPWGGYDSTIVNSGFFYQGTDASDAPVVGCINPASRVCTDSGAAQIFTQGAPRPLINGDWEDFMLRFSPDGSVNLVPPFWERKLAEFQCGPKLNFADICGTGGLGGNFPYSGPTGQPGYPPGDYYPSPIISFNSFTGFNVITLAPDADQDTDTFPTSNDAYNSFMPAYRVMVNTFGEVKVVKVGAFYSGTGTGAVDTTMDGNWQNNGVVGSKYIGDWATNPYPAMTMRGYPVTDYVTTDLLSKQEFWQTAP